jgi:predicted nucleotide-binding protein
VGHEHTRKPGVTVSPGEDSAQDRAAVILTPDQRVRVFISSTLEELAEERAAALRAIRRLHLVPVWYESGARDAETSNDQSAPILHWPPACA